MYISQQASFDCRFDIILQIKLVLTEIGLQRRRREVQNTDRSMMVDSYIGGMIKESRTNKKTDG